MATTTETQSEHTELHELASSSHTHIQPSVTNHNEELDSPPDNVYSTTAIPDGGYGWVIVFGCATVTFWFNSMTNCWGVMQTALLDSTLRNIPASTVSFVGSLNLACGIAFGLFAVRIMRWIGSRMTAVAGIILIGTGLIASGSTTSNVGGLFGTTGAMAGCGMCLVYTVSNSLLIQYFSGKLGLANGLVKLGGGIGSAVMAVALEALVRRVGIEWTFRIQGLMTIGIGIPAAVLLKDRVRIRNQNTPFIELSMFRSLPFTAVFFAGAIGCFALLVPPYYLPLFAQSLGLSSSTGAGLVSAFNLCGAIGRFVAGLLCDKIGSVNTFLGTMLLNAISVLAIWTVSNTFAPLFIFAMLNGIANGSYFTTMPTVVAGIFGPGRAVVALGMATTGWTGGYLMGTPIAGYLLQAAGGNKFNKGQDIDVYRPAILYAGGVAMASSMFVLLARIKLSKKIIKKV